MFDHTSNFRIPKGNLDAEEMELELIDFGAEEVFDDEDEFEFIQKSLNVLKTKTLLLRKRGLSTDIENLVEEQLNKKK